MKEKKRIIFASQLIKHRDNYHLACELYRFIHRHPKLLQQKRWKQVEQTAEEYIIEVKLALGISDDMTREEILSGFRIVTELECKYNDRIFIFGPRTVRRVKNLDKKSAACEATLFWLRKSF